MTKQEQFFFNQAGYSYDPKTETEAQGRERGAKQLARAEDWARDNCMRFDWELEQESAESVFGKPCPRRTRCKDPKCPHAHFDPKADFYSCLAINARGSVVGSLGMIEAPTAEYRRVVQAELALEAMPEVVRP